MKEFIPIILLVVFVVIEIVGTLLFVKFYPKDLIGPMSYGFYDPLTGIWVPIHLPKKEEENNDTDT